MVLTFVLMTLPAGHTRADNSTDVLEISAADPSPNLEPPEAATNELSMTEAATNEIDRTSDSHPIEDVEDQPVRMEPPPPQVIQVQLPAVPMLSREDIEFLTERLAVMEQGMAGQQEKAMGIVLRSNRTILTAAAIVGGLGLAGILGASIVLVRAFNRLSDVMLTLPMGQQLGRGMSLNALAIDEIPSSTTNVLEQVSARFLGALDQLEKRIRGLEGDGESTVPVSESPGNGNIRTTSGKTPSGTAAHESAPPRHTAAPERTKPANETAARGRQKIVQCLEEGESLLQNDKFEEALLRFEAALAIEPNDPDALIKRGMTLERLQRMDAALESYDRAIATNGSLTLAYLHKGAVCNRLQRYREALECYERALQAEQKP